MIILAIETTGSTCGVAVAECTEDGMQLLEVREVIGDNVHDARLARLVERVLTEGRHRVAQVDVVAVSAGPGSFTGTRIGLSFAKGLAMFGTPRLMLVDTSLAIAGAAHEVARAAGKRYITVVIPSHQHTVYVDRLVVMAHGVERTGGWSGPQLLSIADIDPAFLRTDSLVCGPGAPLCSAQPISGLTRLSARFIAREACRHTLYHDPLTAEPLYRQEFVGRHR